MRIPVQDNTTGYSMYASSITDRTLVIFYPCPCDKCTLTFGNFFLKLYPKLIIKMLKFSGWLLPFTLQVACIDAILNGVCLSTGTILSLCAAGVCQSIMIATSTLKKEDKDGKN
jgi:hypothetical protein